MDEETKPESITITHDGKAYTASGLAAKLKGAIVEAGGEITFDDDSAIAALAGFNESENLLGLMDQEQREDFIDEFCEAWSAT